MKEEKAIMSTREPHTRNSYAEVGERLDRDAVTGYFAAILQRLPDLRIAVTRWGARGDAVFIEWVAGAPTAAGHVYYDPGPVRRAIECGRAGGGAS
jgi:SnoaL-like domain